MIFKNYCLIGIAVEIGPEIVFASCRNVVWYCVVWCICVLCTCMCMCVYVFMCVDCQGCDIRGACLMSSMRFVCVWVGVCMCRSVNFERCDIRVVCHVFDTCGVCMSMCVCV